MFKAKNRLWLEGAAGTFLGNGRIQLLEAIQIYGSIAEAAKSMNMSYKKAWVLVKSMTQEAGVPLVTKKIGGAGGGGSILTPQGEKAIHYFKALDQKCRLFIEQEVEKNPLRL